MTNKIFSTLFVVFFVFAFIGQANAEFAQKLDVQLRADDRSTRDIRYQYRIRYKPQYAINDNYSIHGFAATGDEFGASHNTINASVNDYFYVRRFFVRHEGQYGKTEVGIVPTFKGRVSSSGLSKDGWIKGARHVRAIGDNQLEIVVGELSFLDPSKALQLPQTLNYVEIEYSANINRHLSYEISAERMTQANFIRTELRYNYSDTFTFFGELINKIDDNKVKTVIGSEGEFLFKSYPLEYFAYYSYVSEDIGLRAELTEDFLGPGHGFSGEISGDFSLQQFGWFVRFDTVENKNRLLAGIKWSL